MAYVVRTRPPSLARCPELQAYLDRGWSLGQLDPSPAPTPPTEPASARGAAVVTASQSAQRSSVPRALEASAILLSGLFSAASLLAFATGRDRIGYMMGVSGALGGAILGAIRVFGGR